MRRNVWLLLAMAMLSGCVPANDQPMLGLVKGTVKFDGKPLSDVGVTFVPNDGRPAFGTTDAEGKYELTYIRDTKGCKIGFNRVEIGNTEEQGDEMETEGDEATQTVDKSGKPRIPAKYNTKSELSVVVKAGENLFDFDLEKQ